MDGAEIHLPRKTAGNRHPLIFSQAQHLTVTNEKSRGSLVPKFLSSSLPSFLLDPIQLACSAKQKRAGRNMVKRTPVTKAWLTSGWILLKRFVASGRSQDSSERAEPRDESLLAADGDGFLDNASNGMASEAVTVEQAAANRPPRTPIQDATAYRPLPDPPGDRRRRHGQSSTWPSRSNRSAAASR